MGIPKSFYIKNVGETNEKKNEIKNIIFIRKRKWNLAQKCNKLGLSISEYIRQLINDYTPIKIDINIISKHKEDFRMIGNGLNAVARDTHRYGFINECDLNHYSTWLNDVIDEIKFDLEIN